MGPFAVDPQHLTGAVFAKLTHQGAAAVRHLADVQAVIHVGNGDIHIALQRRTGPYHLRGGLGLLLAVCGLIKIGCDSLAETVPQRRSLRLHADHGHENRTHYKSRFISFKHTILRIDYPV